jgi:hypothetical protein
MTHARLPSSCPTLLLINLTSTANPSCPALCKVNRVLRDPGRSLHLPCRRQVMAPQTIRRHLVGHCHGYDVGTTS